MAMYSRVLKNLKNAVPVGATAREAKAAMRVEVEHIFGKWANTTPHNYQKVSDERDIECLRNTMALGKGAGMGNYPLSITDCEVVGINGDCGLECPVFMRGDCDCADEILAEAPRLEVE